MVDYRSCDQFHLAQSGPVCTRLSRPGLGRPGPVWDQDSGSILDILTISQNLNKMKQTWLDECERASIAASNMNLVSPRSVRTMTPALYQPPPVYAAGDYEFPLAGSNLPRPNKYELKRTLSTRSVGPQVSYIARNKSLCAR